ncbi:MAG: MoaD/ThiS family protein [Myxococcales bacterium]|nr:MoaD/ThiS family protein [Myxococcales bacterium]
MPVVHFTQNLVRHVECHRLETTGDTLVDVLGQVFARFPRAKTYVLDEQGAVRKHMVIFVDGKQLVDRTKLTDPVHQSSQIYIMQALSGGV